MNHFTSLLLFLATLRESLPATRRRQPLRSWIALAAILMSVARLGLAQIPICSSGQTVVSYQAGATTIGATTGTVSNPTSATGSADGSTASVSPNSSLLIDMGSLLPVGTVLYLTYGSSDSASPLQVLVASAADGPYTNLTQVSGSAGRTTESLTLPVAAQFIKVQTTDTYYYIDALTYSVYNCVASPILSCTGNQQSVSYQLGAVSLADQTGSVSDVTNGTGSPDGAVITFNRSSSITLDLGTPIAAANPITISYNTIYSSASFGINPAQVLVATNAAGPYISVGQLIPTIGSTPVGQQFILPISAQYVRLVTSNGDYDFYAFDAVTYPVYTCVSSPTPTCTVGQQAVAINQGATDLNGTTGSVNNATNAVGSPDSTFATLNANSTLTLDLVSDVLAGTPLTMTYKSENLAAPLQVLVATDAGGPYRNIGQLPGNTSHVTSSLLLPLNARYVRLQTASTIYTVDALTHPVYTCVVSTNSSGIVFLDGNLNGQKQITEIGVGGITVNVYDLTNTLVASTTTAFANPALNSQAGSYNIPGLTAGQPYRLEFIYDNLPQYSSTTFGSDSPSSVQFILGQTQNHNFGLYVPSNFCSFLPDTRVVTACGTPEAGNFPSVVSFTYFDRGPGYLTGHVANSHTDDILASKIGVPIAMTSQRGTNLVFISPISTDVNSAFPQAPDGPSALYIADYNGPGQTYRSSKLLIKLSDLGIDVGSISNTLGAGPFGVQGLGGIEFSEDSKTLYVVNLFNGKLVKLDVSGVNYSSLPATAPTTASELTPPASLAGCTGGIWRPTALRQFAGKLYMGGVCDASVSTSNTDLKGVVLAYDPATNTWSNALSYPITFDAGTREVAHQPQVSWATTGLDLASTVVEPILLDLAFTDDGIMILGTTNRLVYNASTSSFQTGYVMGASSNNDGTWTLENAGQLGPYTTQAPNPRIEGDGPGGTWFFQQNIVAFHDYLYNGGLYIRSGTGEIVAGYTDPAAYASLGTAYLNAQTGAIQFSNILSSNEGKLSRLTGTNQVCEAVPPLEIGNRVWKDTNNNGIQDVGEPALAGVTVQLSDSLGNVIATAITDADGNYIFSSLNLTSTASLQYSLPLAPGTAYVLKVTSLGTDASTTGLSLTAISSAPGETAGATNTEGTLANNDAFLATGLPTITLRTGAVGQINHTFDFGFQSSPCSLTASVTAGLCTSATNTYSATTVVEITNPPAGDLVVSMGGQSLTVAVASGQRSFSYAASFSGLLSDGASHTVMASLPGCSTATVDYTAPVSCTMVATAGLGNYVFFDANRNGIQDAGDIPVKDVTVILYVNGVASATGVTNATGFYSFTGLTPGDSLNYAVGFTAPTGLTLTIKQAGSSDEPDSDADPATGITRSVTLTAGEFNPDLDAGYTPILASLGDYVFLDANRDGIQNMGDTPISGVTVILYINGVVSVTTVTDATGLYSFTGLTPGDSLNYAVGFSSPVGLTATVQQTGGNDALDSDASPTTGLTRSLTLAPGEHNPNLDAGFYPVAASLALRKFVDRSVAAVGDILTYSLVLTNTSSGSATVTVRDSLSGGVSYVAGSAVAPLGTNFVAGTPTSLWTVPSLAASQSLTLTFQVRVDSTGVLFNTASIPGDTSKVCTSVPIKLCPSEEYFLTAPAGRAGYRWYRDGILITDQTTNVLTVTQGGSYSLGLDNAGSLCSNFSCCPVLFEVDSLPAFVAVTTPASCLGNTPQDNGRLVVSGFNPVHTYQFSAGATFDPAASLSGPKQPIPAGGVLASTLASPSSSQLYTVRVYNGLGCYVDQTVILIPTICGCPADACVPYVISQSKRARRQGDPIR